MKVYTYIKMDINGNVLDEVSYEYEGPIAKCDGSDSDGGYSSLGVGGNNNKSSSNSPYAGMNPDSTAFGGVGTPSERASINSMGGDQHGLSGGAETNTGGTQSYGGPTKAVMNSRGDTINTSARPGTTAAPAGGFNAMGQTDAYGQYDYRGQKVSQVDMTHGYSSAGFANHAATMTEGKAMANAAKAESDAVRAAGLSNIRENPGFFDLVREFGITKALSTTFGFNDEMNNIRNQDALAQEHSYNAMYNNTEKMKNKAAAGSLDMNDAIGFFSVADDYNKAYGFDLTNAQKTADVIAEIGPQVLGVDIPLDPANAAGAMMGFMSAPIVTPVGAKAIQYAVRDDIRSFDDIASQMRDIGFSESQISQAANAQRGGIGTSGSVETVRRAASENYGGNSVTTTPDLSSNQQITNSSSEESNKTLVPDESAEPVPDTSGDVDQWTRKQAEERMGYFNMIHSLGQMIDDAFILRPRLYKKDGTM